MKTTYYLLLCGISLFGCVESDDVQYYEMPLTMILRIQNNTIDTVTTNIGDEYTMKSLEDPSIYHSAEFFKNGKSILKMRTSATIKKPSLYLEQGRRLTEYVRINQETSISRVYIDSIGPTGSGGETEFSENYLMFKNFPFEGINCFKREN